MSCNTKIVQNDTVEKRVRGVRRSVREARNERGDDSEGVNGTKSSGTEHQERGERESQRLTERERERKDKNS